MSRRTTMAGLLGCALLAAPVASTSQAPAAQQPREAAAETSATASAVPGAEVPLPDGVVVPASTGARAWASGTAPNGVTPERLSSVVLDAYTRAAALAPERCHLTVPLLAAIGQVESGNLVGRALDASHRATPAIVGPRLDGGAFKAVRDTDKGQLDGDRKFDRALGPLQFLPSTWRAVGVDLDDDGTRDPQSIYDAAGGAMVYLCGEGRDLADDGDLRDAVLSYNRSQAYLAQVLRWKATFEAAELDQLSSMPAFSAWAVSMPVDRTRVDVAEAVRPVPVTGPTTASRPTTGGSTATAATTPGGSTATTPRPTTPGTTPSTPGDLGTPRPSRARPRPPRARPRTPPGPPPARRRRRPPPAPRRPRADPARPSRARPTRPRRRPPRPPPSPPPSPRPSPRSRSSRPASSRPTRRCPRRPRSTSSPTPSWCSGRPRAPCFSPTGRS